MFGQLDPKNQQYKEYVTHLFCREEKSLASATQRAKQQGLAAIEVPAQVGKFLYLMAKIQKAKRILEIGTLTGYSTIWLARALPATGKLISLELNPLCVGLAQQSLQEANLQAIVEIRQGAAAHLLEQMIRQQEEPFDLIFIDADKENNHLYLKESIDLLAPAGIVMIDNLIPKGEKIGVPCNGEAVAIYAFNRYLANHPQLESVIVTTLVDSQGRLDGLGLARLKD